MKGIYRLPEKPWFLVDDLACLAAAEEIKNYSATNLDAIDLSKKDALLFYISFVSICHDINWDFLFERFLGYVMAERQSKSLVEILCSCNADDVNCMLSGYKQPERIKAKKRAEYLRCIGTVVSNEFDGDSNKIIKLSKGCIGGKNGFAVLMDRFQPFEEDPLRKKTNVLIHELVRNKLVEFKDSSSVKPAVDYHIMRVYLRTGRVYTPKKEILEHLKSTFERERPALITDLREAVSEAVCKVAVYAGLSVADVNFIEWQIGRSICYRDNPLCVSGLKLRETDEDVGKLTGSSCHYINCCTSYSNRDFIQIIELKSNKNYY